MRIFVTGGAGYIGSHTLLKLLALNHNILVYDNFSNSSPNVLKKIAEISERQFEVYNADLRDFYKLNKCMRNFKPNVVMHFAGLKSVSQSNKDPLNFYDQNVTGSINLLKSMNENGCNRVVFSSSATVYGDALYLPVDEKHSISPTNPYGSTNNIVENLLRDWTKASPKASAVVLRYFNPIGADQLGKIGEDSKGNPENLVPILAQVALKKRSKVLVYGTNYVTRDGTGERDYIHIEDLAEAHACALRYSMKNFGIEIFNVGTGKSTTVFELIKIYQEVSNEKIPYVCVDARSGDIAKSIASPKKAKEILGWEAKFGIREAIESSLKWQTENPNGFKKSPLI